MQDRFSFFLWHFPLLIEHENHGDPEKIRRYVIGLQRLRLLRRFAEPFAFGSVDKARSEGEILYAFLVPVTEDLRSPLLPEDTKYEYLVGSVIERKKFKLFGYLWFDSLKSAKDYVTRKNMTIVGGWNEHN
ncbi:MAG: hypothetical protein V4591_05375 [Bdellovibrionota bacterium]